MVWGAVLGACTVFLLPMSASANLGWSGRYYRLLPCITWQNYVNHLGTWNVRGINDIMKREEVVDIFKKGNFKSLALTEMKLKGKEEVIWSGVSHLCRCLEDGKS